jgi:hypothetical protein
MEYLCPMKVLPTYIEFHGFWYADTYLYSCTEHKDLGLGKGVDESDNWQQSQQTGSLRFLVALPPLKHNFIVTQQRNGTCIYFEYFDWVKVARGMCSHDNGQRTRCTRTFVAVVLVCEPSPEFLTKNQFISYLILSFSRDSFVIIRSNGRKEYNSDNVLVLSHCLLLCQRPSRNLDPAKYSPIIFRQKSRGSYQSIVD